VRLIWHVDRDGYRIVRRQRPIYAPVRERSDSDVPLNEGLWRTGLAAVGHHYSWPWDSDAMDFIVPRGGKPKHYETRLLEHPIFLDLANSRQSSTIDEGVLEFVNKWGLLGPLDQPLETFVKWRNTLIQSLDLSPTDIRKRFEDTSLGHLTARFQVVRGGSIQLNFQAETLRQFCALEVLQARAGHIDVTACGACNRFLPLHEKGRPKEYCSNKCKMVAYRRRRRAN
jgi:hypothetical protein